MPPDDLAIREGAPIIAFTADEHPVQRSRALDGLRAFAVVVVMAFHGGLTRFHGGFLGVDVFFALSGYLITSLLINEFDERRAIAFGRFWLRRAKRLLPALMVVILAVCLSALWLTVPGYHSSLHSDVLASFFYVANWHLMGQNSSYFALLDPPSLLTHTWSLSIEEQFYLLWPFVVLGLMRWRSNARLLGVVAGVGALASAGIMAYGLHAGWSTDRLYYGTDTHAEGLLCGAALACFLFAARESGVTMSRLTTNIAQWVRFVGPLAIIGGLVVMDRAYGTSNWMFQGGFLGVAICASVTILYLVTLPKSLVARGLGWGPIVYVGQISYGLYLWHYPIFLWITSQRSSLHGIALFALRVAVSFAAAVVSYHVIEMPVRRRAWPTTWRGALVGVLALVLVLGTSVTIADAANQIPTSTPPAASATLTPVRALILGDSEALSLAYSTARWGPHYGLKVDSGAILGCGLVPMSLVRIHGTVSWAHRLCRPWRHGGTVRQFLWGRLIRKSHPAVIFVLSGHWETHDIYLRGRWRTINNPLIQRDLVTFLRVLSAEAERAHSTLVVATSPCINDGEQMNGEPWPENDPRRLDAYNYIIRAYALSLHYSVYDLNAQVCPGGHYSTYLHGYMVRTADGVHFAPQSAPFLAPRLFPYLRRVATAERHA